MPNKVTTRCPLCGTEVEVHEHNMVTRTDALLGHIFAEHGSRWRPATPLEGPPLPRGLKVRWPGLK